MKRSLFCFLYVGNIHIPVASCDRKMISRHDSAHKFVTYEEISDIVYIKI